MHKLFACLSLAILVLIGWTAWDEHEPEWEAHQKRYYRAFAKIQGADLTDEQIDLLPTGIQQDWLPDLGATDRCRTCHVGVDNPAMRDAPQPLATHPFVPFHPFRTFGCTVCHEGQGRATTREDAHGHVPHWDYPLLPGRVVEGACGKCHMGWDVEFAPALNDGRRLIAESGCAGCHEMSGFEKPARIGPDLVGLGSKVRPQWLYRWLKRPKDYLERTRMPNFGLSDEEIHAIMAFLLSSRNEAMETDLSPMDEEEREELTGPGRARFGESRCVSCHSLGGRGGTVGPDLGEVAGKVYKRWLYNWLANPPAYQPGTRMPTFAFPSEDVRAITEYMNDELLPEEEEGEVPLPEFTPELASAGRRLVVAKGCYACHELPEGLRGGPYGPSLAEIGSKPLYKLDFGKTEIARSLANWIFVKLQEPRAFGENLKMPDFEFRLEEAEAITIALLGETRKEIPAKFVVGDPTRPGFRVRGPFHEVIERFACLTCHSIFGFGGTMAPDLSIEGSAVQHDWLVDYLVTPYAVRPYLTERMPRLKISRAEAERIAGYIETILRSDEIDAIEIGPLGPEDVAEGRRLFYEEYTCPTCHTIGTTATGYYGPQLDNVGERLEPEWIYARLKDPAKWSRESREPNFDIPEADARALAAFLGTLRPSLGREGEG